LFFIVWLSSTEYNDDCLLGSVKKIQKLAL